MGRRKRARSLPKPPARSRRRAPTSRRSQRSQARSQSPARRAAQRERRAEARSKKAPKLPNSKMYIRKTGKADNVNPDHHHFNPPKLMLLKFDDNCLLNKKVLSFFTLKLHQ